MSGLAPTTRVVRSDTGAQVALAEVADARAAVPVWALDRELRIVPATIAVLTRRTTRVHEVRLASGRSAAVADDHHVLTRDGWMPADTLQIGTRVAVPRVVPDPVDPVWWPDDEVILLAHLLANPGATGRRPLCYSTGEEANADAVEKAAAHFGVVPRRVRHGDWWRLYLPSPANLPRGDRHPMLGWLDELGVAGEAEQAHLPAGVFALDRRQLALFVRHLWAAGGVLRIGDGQPVLSYGAGSRAMVDDVQAVLDRFGVATRVRRGRGPDAAWHVMVLGADAQYRFIDEIGAHPGGGHIAQRIARFLAATGDARLDRRPTSDIGWDVVTSSQAAGEQPVCAATVTGPERPSERGAGLLEPALLAGGIVAAAG